MIKINLQKRKAAVGVTSGSATGGAGSFSAQLSGALSKMGGGDSAGDIKGAFVQVIFLGAIVGGIYWYTNDLREKQLAEIDAQIATLDSKVALLNSELNKTAGYEQTKRNLEQDEKTIRTKIETIQKLIRDRSTPPKILMTLSEAIPTEVWLRDFSLQGPKFSISGTATSMDLVSDFMKNLEETIFFKSIVLKSSRTEPGRKVGHQNALFEIEGERR